MLFAMRRFPRPCVRKDFEGLRGLFHLLSGLSRQACSLGVEVLHLLLDGRDLVCH